MGISDDREIKQVEDKLTWIKNKSKEATELISQIKTKSSRYNSTLTTLEEIKSEATLLAKAYKAKERTIENQLNQAERFYTQNYLPLKAKIDDKQTGLKRITLQGEIFLKEIDTKRQKLVAANNVHQENIKALNSILSESRKTGRAISVTAKKANTESSHIDNKLTESQKILTSIKSHANQTSKFSSEISELLSKSQQELATIVESKNNILNSEIAINKIEEDAISTNDKINKLYGFANNSVMAGAFGDRRDKLEKELSLWHTKVLIATTILFISVVFLLGIQMYLNDWTLKGLSYDFYLRFLFVGPIFYYIVFCNTQYNHTRRILDKYTFKATVALTIEAHTELLSKNFTEEEFKKDILNFSLESLNKVYDRPYIDEMLMAKIKEDRKSKGNELTIEALRKELSSKDSSVYKLLSSISGSISDKK